MGDRVVQLARQLLALAQPDLVGLAQPRAGAVADRGAERGGKQQEQRSERAGRRKFAAERRREAVRGEDDRHPGHRLDAAAPPEQGVREQQDVRRACRAPSARRCRASVDRVAEHDRRRTPPRSRARAACAATAATTAGATPATSATPGHTTSSRRVASSTRPPPAPRPAPSRATAAQAGPGPAARPGTTGRRCSPRRHRRAPGAGRAIGRKDGRGSAGRTSASVAAGPMVARRGLPATIDPCRTPCIGSAGSPPAGPSSRSEPGSRSRSSSIARVRCRRPGPRGLLRGARAWTPSGPARCWRPPGPSGPGSPRSSC